VNRENAVSNNEQTEVAIPDGFMLDAQGRLVPEKAVREIDKLRDQTVRKIVEQAIALNKAMVAFKAGAFSDIATFVATSADQFGVEMGGNKGNVTLRSYDGRYKIERAVQERVEFDERLQAAKELIDECITAWGAKASDELRALVRDVFKVDQQGRVSTYRILGLKRYAFQDPKWQTAMEAIAQSLTVVGSSTYVRIYQRVGDTDRYVPIPLDLAAI